MKVYSTLSGFLIVNNGLNIDCLPLPFLCMVQISSSYCIVETYAVHRRLTQFRPCFTHTFPLLWLEWDQDWCNLVMGMQEVGIAVGECYGCAEKVVRTVGVIIGY